VVKRENTKSSKERFFRKKAINQSGESGDSGEEDKPMKSKKQASEAVTLIIMKLRQGGGEKGQKSGMFAGNVEPVGEKSVRSCMSEKFVERRKTR